MLKLPSPFQDMPRIFHFCQTLVTLLLLPAREPMPLEFLQSTLLSLDQTRLEIDQRSSIQSGRPIPPSQTLSIKFNNSNTVMLTSVRRLRDQREISTVDGNISKMELQTNHSKMLLPTEEVSLKLTLGTMPEPVVLTTPILLTQPTITTLSKTPSERFFQETLELHFHSPLVTSLMSPQPVSPGETTLISFSQLKESSTPPLACSRVMLLPEPPPTTTKTSELEYQTPTWLCQTPIPASERPNSQSIKKQELPHNEDLANSKINYI